MRLWLDRLTAPRRSMWQPVSIAAVILLAAMTRLYNLDTKSLWLDEAFSVFVASHALEEMLAIIIRHDTPPPLYYTLLHLWLVFGEEAFAVRSLSALLGIATAPVVYLLGREVAGHRVGIVAGVLLALSPFQVWYGQEARMYALLALLSALSAYFLLRGLKGGGTTVWAAYVVSTALALYTQLSAAFFIMAEGIAVLIFWLLSSRSPVGRAKGQRDGGHVVARSWKAQSADETRTEQCARSIDEPVPEIERPPPVTTAVRSWLLSQVVIALLWLPWLPNLLRQSQTYRDFWIPVPTVATLRALLFDLTSFQLPHWRVLSGQEIVALSGASLALLAIVRFSRREYAFLLILVVVPIAAVYAVSQVKPIFLSRALIYVSVPYLVLLAGGLASLQRRHLGALLLGTLLAINLISLYRLYGVVPKEQWQLATGYVTTRAEPDDLVLFVAADTQIPFDYYALRQDKPLQRHGLPVDVFTVGHLEPRVKVDDLTRVDLLAADRDSFWLVASHTVFADPAGLVRKYVTERYALVDAQRFYGVEIYRFRATRPAGPLPTSSTARQGKSAIATPLRTTR